jgi:hypothetical protein
MTLEERISDIETKLEAARFVISALLGASQDAGKVALFLNLFGQQIEENPSVSTSFSSEQRKAVRDLLAKYEESAIQVADAANRKTI